MVPGARYTLARSLTGALLTYLPTLKRTVASHAQYYMNSMYLFVSDVNTAEVSFFDS